MTARALLSLLALLTGCDRAEEPHFRVAASTVAAPEEEAVARERPTAAVERMPMIDPDRVAGRLVLEPADLTTSTYEAFPTVAIPRRGVSERELARFVERCELVTWPEREVVPTTPRYLDEALEPASYSRIVLEPREPLRDRWYAVRVRFDPADAPDETIAPRDGSFSVSRFRVGPGGVVRRVHARAREGGGGDVQVLFSERVHLDVEVFSVAIDGTAADCTLSNRAELFGEEGAVAARLDCPSLSVGSSITVSTTAPVFSISGAEVRDAAGAALDGRAVVLLNLPRGAPEPRHDLVGADHPVRAARDDPETARTFVPSFGLPGAI
jgi:hypothetical protein